MFSNPSNGAELSRLLSAATVHLLTAKDPDELVRGIFDIAAEPLGLDAYFNYVAGESGAGLRLASCFGIAPDVAERIRCPDFGQATCGKDAETCKPLTAAAIQESGSERAALARRLGIRVYVCNPLMSGGRLLGTLSFASRRRDEFTGEELEFFRTLCHYVELTVERLQLLDRLQHHADLLDLAKDSILSLRLDGTIQFWSKGAELTYGWTSTEALGRRSHDLLETRFPQGREDIEAALLRDEVWNGELAQTRRDGSKLTVSSRWALQKDTSGHAVGFLEINRDITERKRLEEQLRQTAKLESLGVLAGGIAHDFNNLLVGILGNASLAADNLPAANPNHAFLQEVVKAAERAAMLTRQLLAYAGKGRFETHRANLSELVREAAGLVQAAAPKWVRVRFELDPDLPAVEVDVAQIQQVVMNLVMNAAEAMGQDPGTVLITTASVDADLQYLGTLRTAFDVVPGRYVCLEVNDTGCGMDESTVSRIFDPFFTTKFHGRGLGLSAVQGIVRSHKGALKVYSTPGKGSTFKLLLPAVAEASAAVPSASVPEDLRGEGTVLVVDDEATVRGAAQAALERFGYSVLVAADGSEALDVFAAQPRISLVLLDLTMPVMNGEETLRKLKILRPDVRVVLSSGYNEVEAIRRFTGKGLAGFIQKPYTARALAAKVKSVLAKRSSAGR